MPSHQLPLSAGNTKSPTSAPGVRICRRCEARIFPTGSACWRCGSKRIGVQHSKPTEWDRLARFHPAWVVYLFLVLWLAVRGEMGREFIVPWFVLLTPTFFIHQALRSRGKSDMEMLLRLLWGPLQGLLASALLLAVTASITYSSSGGPDWYTVSHHPNRTAMTLYAVAVAVLVAGRVALIVMARRRISTTDAAPLPPPVQ